MTDPQAAALTRGNWEDASRFAHAAL